MPSRKILWDINTATKILLEFRTPSDDDYDTIFSRKKFEGKKKPEKTKRKP